MLNNIDQVKPRCGLYIYLKNMRQEKQIKKLGTIQFVSRRQKYVYIYIDKLNLEDTLTKLNDFSFVKEVKVSHIGEIPHYYDKLEEVEKDDNLFI